MCAYATGAVVTQERSDDVTAAIEELDSSDEEDSRIAWVRLEVKFKKRRFTSILLASAEICIDDLPPHTEVCTLVACGVHVAGAGLTLLLCLIHRAGVQVV